MSTYKLPSLHHDLRAKKLSMKMPSIDWRNQGSGSLSGKVTDASTPAQARLDINLSDSKQYVASTTTSIDGTYQFDLLDPNEKYDVVATLEGSEYERKVSSNRRPTDFDPKIKTLRNTVAGELTTTDLWTGRLASYLKFEGSSGGTTFPDETGGSWTATNVTTDESVFKWGTSSAKFNGGTGTTVSYLDKGELVDLTGNFTFQAWVCPNVVPAGWSGLFFLGLSTSNSHRMSLSINPTVVEFYRESTASHTASANYVATPGEWFFIEASVDNDVVRIFINGTKMIEISGTIPKIVPQAGSTLRLGHTRSSNTLRYFDGYIGEARFIVGDVLHRRNYTPPDAPLNIL